MSDPTVTKRKVRFGFTRTLEYSPIEGETKGKDWKMFPELFLTKRGAKIYDVLNKHQGMRIMRMKILHAQNPSKLVASGKNQPSVSGIISEAMDKVHRLTIRAPPMTPEFVKQIMKTEGVAKVNVGLVRDLETQLGRAVIHRDYKESNNLAQVGKLLQTAKEPLKAYTEMWQRRVLKRK